jgi:8-oxo-dGTP diphosphatase
MKQSEIEEFYSSADQYLRNVEESNVIFGYHDKELMVLLQQPFTLDKWTVTGGFIKRTESIEEAAARIAFSRTGLKDLFFRQFGSFGNPQRSIDSGFTAKHVNEVTGAQVSPDYWIFDYFVSVSFYTLTEFSKVKPQKGPYESEIKWWPVADIPPMMFDHKLIISEALKALRLHIAHFPIGYELLPEKFTLPEIHSLYQTVLGRPLDDRNFTRRLMATGILIKLAETKQIGPHRSPILYKFDKEKYENALNNGLTLAF